MRFQKIEAQKEMWKLLDALQVQNLQNMLATGRESEAADNGIGAVIRTMQALDRNVVI